MLACVYILLCMLTGWAASNFIVHLKTEKWEDFNKIWIYIPGYYLLGTLLLTWVTYLLGMLFQNMEQPLQMANVIAMSLSGIFVLLSLRYQRENFQGWMVQQRNALYEALFFLIAGIVVAALMFYVFYIKDGVMYEGYTVFSDFSPHISLIRSFSRGNNFPTQYPYFGGSDIRYHFLFQFLIGNLEYLGMRIDVAFNLVSTVCILAALMLLYALAWRITKRRLTGALTVFSFFGLCGPVCIPFLLEHIKAGDLLQTLTTHDAFIGYLTQETWGLWCFNVFLNQRHLALGLGIMLMALLYYLPYLEETFKQVNLNRENLLVKAVFHRENWSFRQVRGALLCGFLIGMLAFWNGAVTIATLLILFVFAAFSCGKLDYLLTAGVALFLTFLQSHLFVNGSAVSTSLYWGFIAEDTSAAGVLKYLLQTWGILFLVLAVYLWKLNRVQKIFAMAALLPFVFAFTVSLTPDVTVNHKYIMISVMLLSVFVSDFLVRLWERKAWGAKCLVLFLGFVLYFTGIYDMAVIWKNNDKEHRVSQEVDSEITQWLMANTDSGDLILTDAYYINEVTVSGCMMYYGWPYYAWSAGYDTDGRQLEWQAMYLAEDAGTLRAHVLKNGITYIIVAQNQTIENWNIREDIIQETYPLVYTSSDGQYRIYQTEE